MANQAKIQVTGPKVDPGTLEYYEETAAVYARDAETAQRRSQGIRDVSMTLDEQQRKIVWGNESYSVQDLDQARGFVSMVNEAAARARIEAPRAVAESAKVPVSKPVAARRRALQSGGLLEGLGFLYGMLAIVGAVFLAMQEDSFGDRPFVGVAVAAGFVGVILATFLVAFGRLVSAWALTHGVEDDSDGAAQPRA